MGQDNPIPASYSANSGQYNFEYSEGTSFGDSYGEDDRKDSAWERRNNKS